MDRASLSSNRRPRSGLVPQALRTACLCGAGLLLAGCGTGPASFLQTDPVTRASGASPPEQLPATLPALRPHPYASATPPAATLPAENPKSLPIALDTVLQLAQDQNGQVAIAREKVREACANLDLAAKSWLPDLWVGAGYYRHEGGIQNEDGTLTHSSFGSLFAGLELGGRLDLKEATYRKIDAERRLWQQRGELTKLTSENLLDATSTYIDLLTARTGEAVALGLEQKLRSLLNRAEKLATVDPGVGVEVARIRAEIGAQQQITRKLREGARSAAAKLLYLLGLDPNAELVVLDRQLTPLHLVDVNAPVAALVDQAVASGPGIREMEGLLGLIQDADAKSRGLGQYLPVFDVRVAEGAFGAGPGSRSDWDNRFDLGLQVRWNLTNLATARERQRVTQHKMQQAYLTHQDLRAKLTLGVQEAYEASHSNREQIGLGEGQVKDATDAYDRSIKRLDLPGDKRGTPSEVLLAIRSMGGAQLGYLQAIRELDKAQLRLLVLTGAAATTRGGHCAQP